MTLDKAKAEQKLRIVRIHGGHLLRDRLYQMGLFEGTNIAVKQISRLGGPLLIECGGSRIALGRGMARQIDVEEIESNALSNEK
ncbi:MAG: ferrous iron transport protein A [candidate division KSB1 bacterium]|nr:ferrous iron transport protein A [candidate division KSB1 bacterium]